LFETKTSVLFSIENQRLIKDSWQFELGSILHVIEESVRNIDQGVVQLEIHPKRMKEPVNIPELFLYEFAKESVPYSAVESENYVEQLVTGHDSFYLNPNDLFSFKVFTRRILGDFPQQKLSSEVSITDNYGMDQAASLFFSLFLRIGFKIEEHWHHEIYPPDAPWFKPGLDVSLAKGRDLRARNTTGEPWLFKLRYESGVLEISAKSCFQKDYSVSLREATRKMNPAKMLTMLDKELHTGEQRIEREPLPGLSVTIEKVTLREGREPRASMVWKATYEPVDGLLYIGTDEMNIYDKEW
jgi:hypothetical protein